MRCKINYSGLGSVVGLLSIATVTIALGLALGADLVRGQGAEPSGDRFMDRAEKIAFDRQAAERSSPAGPRKSRSNGVRLPHIAAKTLLAEDFNSGLPAGWTVLDNEGNGVVWAVPQAFEGNYTGGTGDAAGASSDQFGTADYDTELRTPIIMSGYHPNTTLTYTANYQNLGLLDFLDVDISTDGGSNWTTVLSWNEDHGEFRGTPGEQVVLALDPFVGPTTPFMLRWRYYNPTTTPDWDWYAQIDDVMIVSDPNCACPRTPTPDTADFKVGDPVPLGGGIYDVSLYANTEEAVTFTQMAFDYDSNCLTYVNNSVALGADVSGASTSDVFIDITDVGGTTKRMLLNVAGTYTGCDQEVFKVQFEVTGTAPCDLTWFKTDEGPNSRNHLNYDSAGDGKITPDFIAFCDGAICDADIAINGQVTYYSNGELILDNVPDDPESEPVTVEDCTMTPTTMADINADYALSFGHGPVYIELCASRPIAGCGTDEDGVISGDDVISIQDEAGRPQFLRIYTARQNVAAKGSGDGQPFVTQADVLAVKRWIARKVCDGTDSCGGANDNCVATWKFLFLTGPTANDFEVDTALLGDVCGDRTIDIEGVLVGDVDGSWPNFFPPKPAFLVDLDLRVNEAVEDEVTVSLNVDLDAGETLRHVIYSLEYDADAFEYFGIDTGAVAPEWPALDNAEIRGEGHGIAHRPALTDPLSKSGEVIVFRFRALHAGATSRVSFTRLKANDVDVEVADVVISADGDGIAAPTLPTRYSLSSHPNPFNPRTRVEYTIPAGVERVPVQLRVYDITGRLVRTLESADRGPGRYTVDWDGTSNNGGVTGAGIYLLRIQAGTWSQSQKLTLVK